MAKRTSKKKPTKKRATQRNYFRTAMRWIARGTIGLIVLVVLLMFLGRFVPPWTTAYMFSESRKLGGVTYEWVPSEKNRAGDGPICCGCGGCKFLQALGL